MPVIRDVLERERVNDSAEFLHVRGGQTRGQVVADATICDSTAAWCGVFACIQMLLRMKVKGSDTAVDAWHTTLITTVTPPPLLTAATPKACDFYKNQHSTAASTEMHLHHAKTGASDYNFHQLC